MSLEEQTMVDEITYRQNGVIEVRRVTAILRDGSELARTFHRHSLEPGADVSGEDPKVRAVAAVLWTPDLINVYRAGLIAAGL